MKYQPWLQSDMRRLNAAAAMNTGNLWNCSTMWYFSIRWFDGRAMATMSSVTLGGRRVWAACWCRAVVFTRRYLTRRRRGLWSPAGLPSSTRVLHSGSLYLRRPAGRGSWVGWPSPGSLWPGCRRAGVPVCARSTLASSCTNDTQPRAFTSPTLPEFILNQLLNNSNILFSHLSPIKVPLFCFILAIFVKKWYFKQQTLYIYCPVINPLWRFQIYLVSVRHGRHKSHLMALTSPRNWWTMTTHTQRSDPAAHTHTLSWHSFTKPD